HASRRAATIVLSSPGPHATTSPGMPTPPSHGPDVPAGVSFADPALASTRVSRAPARLTDGFAQETRALLRQRLLVAHALSAPVCCFYLLSILAGGEHGAFFGTHWLLGAAGFGVLVLHGGAVGLCLWKHPEARLGSLRGLELAFFGALVLLFSALKFDVFLTFSGESPDDRFAKAAVDRAAVVSSLPFYFTIF